MFRPSVSFLLLLPIPLWLGCGSGGSQEHPLPPATTVSIQLLNQPSEDYKAVHLFVEAVDVKIGSDWIQVAAPKRLVTLQHQPESGEALVQGQLLPRGKISSFRLRLAQDRSRVILAAGAQPLGLPEGLSQGLIVPLTGSTRRRPDSHCYVLMLDLARAIQQNPQGSPAPYTLWPAVRAVDSAETGSISGRLLDSLGVPLAAVTVTAQEPEGASPVLARRVVTDSDGRYQLNLLPLARSYHVVSMPRSAHRLFAAQASPALLLTRAEPSRSFQFSFQPTPSSQSLLCQWSGPVRPVPQQIELLQQFPTGLCIVQTAQALSHPDGHESRCQLDHLPTGTYQVRVTGFQQAADGLASAVPAASAKPCEVKADRPTLLQF